jgi:DNA-binding response OmpR family regulator
MRTWKPRRPVVLVIDDDPDILQLLGMCLSAEGCDVRQAFPGPDALAMLDGVDVLVVDQRRPNLSGTDLIALARTKGFSGRVLAILSSRHARSDADLTRVDGFLAKPIGPRELMAEVERLFYLNNPPCRSTDRSSRTSVVPTKA